MTRTYVDAGVLIAAEESVTTETLDKPIHRAKGVKIVSIHPAP